MVYQGRIKNRKRFPWCYCLIIIAIVAIVAIAHSIAAIDTPKRESTVSRLTLEQQAEIMSRITRPALIVADAENLDAYNRHLTRTVEENWRASK